MTTTRASWRNRDQTQTETEAPPVPVPVAEKPALPTVVPLDIPPTDPLIEYLQRNVSGVVDIEHLNLDSEGVRALRQAGVRLALPLVSQGALVGLINLGQRRSDQDYSSDDRRLLGNLATQAAPAVRVAQLVRQQQLEALERQRIEQELRVARLIQQTLLPKDVPHVAGWEVDAYYQPARAVGGDFYDFISYPDGRLGFVIGDVTDKGVPAALVMATTRSLLRSAAERFESPSAILERTNDLLVEDIPPKMFVTCLFGLLDPDSGHFVYANAGHDVPYLRTENSVMELRARGMPLGLLPGMKYEEKEVSMRAGDCLLLYSDGLVEAHSPTREMLGFPRLQALMSTPTKENLVPFLLERLREFTGPGWEQEDDVTMVLLRHSRPTVSSPAGRAILARFDLPSEPGNERRAMEQIGEIVAPLGLPTGKTERLKTAVAEATMNAMEHGNKYSADKAVSIEVVRDEQDLIVSITDRGGARLIPDAEAPDLTAKLAGQQSPRGWGLFLIRNMVDDLQVVSDDRHHTVNLIIHLSGGER
ncbi:MAG: SpoIIE family protein phosphatase [Anaerolineae bacterium]|uniref:ATP-binding SpoIIE family protein phosphatase n=1 Tax=Promineifilum sp. TaxID=2664178 RepID=UPI001E094C8B|nr:SpoIIE family protein phosphatase [Anaerolineales bacterium]MCB8935702.1 SpoIIE family protein phosphatase [Promineifilum sp.]MCO5181943.1 SpoIIE family protein phosphatase [Promineifilum sp.]MCW5846957.1 SpoIIE family protein phosphatase [Anaerolineae bacterium]